MATVAALVVTLLVLMGAGLAMGPAAPRSSTTGAHPTLAGVAAPAARPSAGNVSATLSFQTTVPLYEILPFHVGFNVSVTNATISSSNTWVTLAIKDVALVPNAVTGVGECTSVFALAPCPTVGNISLNSSVGAGTTSYTATVTAAALAGYGPLPEDQYLIQPYVTINNGVNNGTFGAQAEAYIVTGPPTAQFVAPLPNSALSTGNVTFVVEYGGSYLNGANVSVYRINGANRSLVYVQGVFAPGSGNRTVGVTTAWFVSVPGDYQEVLTVTAPYTTATFLLNLTVVPAGSNSYLNQTVYNNDTLFPGLGGAASGTILLVVGLIVGLVTAMVLGRMMWAGGAKAAPAQPWSAAKANECSVCHQTFDTEDAMKEHQKTAHGMS